MLKLDVEQASKVLSFFVKELDTGLAESMNLLGMYELLMINQHGHSGVQQSANCEKDYIMDWDDFSRSDKRILEGLVERFKDNKGEPDDDRRHFDFDASTILSWLPKNGGEEAKERFMIRYGHMYKDLRNEK